MNFYYILTSKFMAKERSRHEKNALSGKNMIPKAKCLR